MAKTVTAYSSGSKFFHWFIAVIVILMLSGSYFLDDVPEQFKSIAFMYHKSFGLTVLAFMIFRVLWIIHTGKPALPSTVPAWQRGGAHVVQYSLYLLLFLMPLAGWAMSVAADRIPVFFGLFPIPMPFITPDKALAGFMKECHNTMAWMIIVLLILHIAGAMKHHFIDKDIVLRRMLPWGKK